MRTRDKRIARVQHAIDASPVRRHVLREAYEVFTLFGELPDDDHVAYEVVQQALRGGDEEEVADYAQVTERVRRAALAYHQRERPGSLWPPSVRAMLFDEALFECPALRKVARAAIATEVAWGGDVENPAFGARHGMPGYGSVALHVCDWPTKLAMPPYEARATQLFVRLDNVRGRIDHDDASWFDAQAKAMVGFYRTGELPEDELHLEAVLVDFETDLLFAHRRGEDVSEAMALLDTLARGCEEEQDAALQKVRELAVARRRRR